MRRLARWLCAVTGHVFGSTSTRHRNWLVDYCPRCRCLLGVWEEERCL